MTAEVEFQRDDRIYFSQAICSAKDAVPPICVSQTVSGSIIFVEIGPDKYAVHVDKLAIAIADAVRAASVPPTPREP